MTKLREWMVGVPLACLWACGAPEQATVDQFFRAAQSNDNPTIAAMSAVGPPLMAESWTTVEVTSRSTEPFSLPELLEEFEAAEKEREATLEEGRNYMAEEVDALDQIIPKLQEDPDYEFTGRLGEVQEKWQTLLEERKEKERAYQELRRAVEREKRLAAKSVMNRGANIENLEGSVAVTEMLVNLNPRDSDEERPFNVTLRKYDLSSSGSDRPEQARWIIADIEGATPEARAAAEKAQEREAPVAAAAPAAPAAASEPAPEPAAAPESEAPARSEQEYMPRELRGLARVQILPPETRVEGNDVVTTVRARNASRDWITRFTVTEYWYDQQGTASLGGSRTYEDRFMPGEVIELQLRTQKNPNYYQNQFEFKHANGEVDATVVRNFPGTSS